MRNEKDRIRSITILASKVGCSAQNLKQKLFEQFDKMNPNSDDLLNLVEKNASKMEEQANNLNMHPNDTPARIMIELLDEYYVIHKSKIKSRDQIFKEAVKDNSGLKFQFNEGIDPIEEQGNINHLKSSPRGKEKDRFQSKTNLASKIGCPVQNLKEKVFEQFDSVDVPIDEFKKLIAKHNATKSDHASIYKMHPDDTPAALMIEMLEEYILILQSRKKSKDQIFREMATNDP